MLWRRSARGLVALALLVLVAAPWRVPAVHGQVPVATISLAGLGGIFPVNVDINEQTNRVYVVARNSNNVIVLDGTAGGFVASVPVGPGPFDVAVNPLSNLIYVTNDGQPPSVSVINGTTNSVVATIPLTSSITPTAGVTPTPFVAVNPATNTVYVTDNSRNVIHVINGATNTLVTSIPVTLPAGFQLRGIAVNPNTNKYYVVRSNQTPGASAGSVQVFSGVTNTPGAVITVGVGPEDIVVDPVRNRVYVTNLGTTGTGGVPGTTLSVINGATDTFVTNVTVGSAPRGVDVNTSDGRVFVANSAANSVSVVDGPSAVALNTVSVTGAAWVGVNSTAGQVYVTSGAQNTVTVLSDLDGCPSNTGTVTLSQSGTSGVFGTLSLTFNPATNTTTVSGTISGVTSAPTVSIVTNAGPPQPRTVTGTAPVGGISTVSGTVAGAFFAGSQVTVGTQASGLVVCTTPAPTPPPVSPGLPPGVSPGLGTVPQVIVPAVPRPPVQIIPSAPPPLLPPGPPIPPLQSAARQGPPGAPPMMPPGPPPTALPTVPEQPAPTATPTAAAPAVAPTTATPVATPTGGGTQPAPGQVGPAEGPSGVPQQPTPVATPRAEAPPVGPSTASDAPEEPATGAGEATAPEQSSGDSPAEPGSESSELPVPIEGAGLLALGLVTATRWRGGR